MAFPSILLDFISNFQWDSLFINTWLLFNAVFQAACFHLDIYIFFHGYFYSLDIYRILFLFWSFFLFEVQEPQDIFYPFFYTCDFLRIMEVFFILGFCLFFLIWKIFTKFEHFLYFICSILFNYILALYCLSISLLFKKIMCI